MTTLILAGEIIVAASDSVTAYAGGWQTPDALFPTAAGITGTEEADLPPDFEITRYVWRNGALERLPDPPVVVPVPASVTARQARLALDAAGLLDDVDAAIAASPRAVQLTWEYATEIERDNPILAQVASGFGLTSEQMDDLFRQAATL